MYQAEQNFSRWQNGALVAEYQEWRVEPSIYTHD